MSKSRRGHGEGTISRRSDGRWEARVTLPDGTRKALYAKTRQEAQAKLRQAQSDIERGLPLADEQQTVATYLTGWLATIAPTVRASTLLRYTYDVRRNILPTLGHVKLARLSAQQVQTLYAAKLAAGLSTTSVRHLHACLHKALASAVRLGLVPRNVADMVDAPQMRAPHQETLTPEEARQLLASAHADGDRLEALWALAIHTGMREGELLALRWRDVDLSGMAGKPATVQVRASLSISREKVYDAQTGLTQNRPVYSEPKTAKGKRRIRLTPQAVEALRAHRTRQKAERLHAGEVWRENDLVFCSQIGTPLYARNVIRSFRRRLAKAGLRQIRFHDLRHTAATLLLLGYVQPQVVSEMLGHATPDITSRIYSHVLPDMQANAADVMAHLLRDPREVALELDREQSQKRDGSED